jgi:hypothetical protein
MQHPTFSATLAEEHRDQLRRQADQVRRSRGRPAPAGLGAHRHSLRLSAERLIERLRSPATNASR